MLLFASSPEQFLSYKNIVHPKSNTIQIKLIFPSQNFYALLNLPDKNVVLLSIDLSIETIPLFLPFLALPKFVLADCLSTVPKSRPTFCTHSYILPGYLSPLNSRFLLLLPHLGQPIK